LIENDQIQKINEVFIETQAPVIINTLFAHNEVSSIIVIIILSVSTSVCYSGTVYFIRGNMSSTTIVYNFPPFNREILGSIPVSAQPDSALNDSAVPSVSVDNSAHNITSAQNDCVSFS